MKDVEHSIRKALHETDKINDLRVSDSDADFLEIAAKPYVGDALAARVAAADLVLVPDEQFREHTGPFFPQSTEDFYTFLTDHAPDELTVEAAVEDDDYRELALHSEFVILAGLLVTEAALPVSLNLISDYIWTHIHSPRRDRAVRVELTVVDDKKARKRTKKFTYEGTPEHFGEACEKIERLWKSP